MIYQFMEASGLGKPAPRQSLAGKKDTTSIRKLPLKKMIEKVNEEFLEKVNEWFVEHMFGLESRLSREDFIKKLQTETFRWLFSPQTIRDKIDEWIKSDGPKSQEEEKKSIKQKR